MPQSPVKESKKSISNPKAKAKEKESKPNRRKSNSESSIHLIVNKRRISDSQLVRKKRNKKFAKKVITATTEQITDNNIDILLKTIEIQQKEQEVKKANIHQKQKKVPNDDNEEIEVIDIEEFERSKKENDNSKSVTSNQKPEAPKPVEKKSKLVNVSKSKPRPDSAQKVTNKKVTPQKQPKPNSVEKKPMDVSKAKKKITKNSTSFFQKQLPDGNKKLERANSVDSGAFAAEDAVSYSTNMSKFDDFTIVDFSKVNFKGGTPRSKNLLDSKNSDPQWCN